MSEFLKRTMEEMVAKFGPPPASFTFGDGIDWSTSLVETTLYVELPFWLMTPAGDVRVQWARVDFVVTICPPWTEVFLAYFTDSRLTSIHQGPITPEKWLPSQPWADEIAARGDPVMERHCKTVLRLTTAAHSGAFREITDADPPRVSAEQEAYWASLCEAHIPVVNELIQRFRLVTYDYFAYEVSAWDVPVWYIKHEGRGFRSVLLPYQAWDDKPVTIEDADTPGDPPRVRPFEWVACDELANASSTDATPGEFDLLDARSLMERGDYTGAVRRTVTAIEALVESVLLTELEKKYDPAEATRRLELTKNDFPGRLRQWRKLSGSTVSQAEIDNFNDTREVRHQIVHRGLRLTHNDRYRAQRMVDTGRWLYNKTEAKPERAKVRDKGVLKSVGRAALALRFPSTLSATGITLGPLAAPNE
jgi:hypothetical protein